DPVVWARGGEAPGSTEVQDRVWAAVHAAVMEGRGPRVIDSGADPDDWCVEPADLYRWANPPRPRPVGVLRDPHGFQGFGNIINKGPLPKKAAEDAVHIAVAVVNGLDYLITWN
ncbi:MAG: hypothetical protein ACREBC_19850, partial [Pyrinomonadaceae bacterium]